MWKQRNYIVGLELHFCFLPGGGTQGSRLHRSFAWPTPQGEAHASRKLCVALDISNSSNRLPWAFRRQQLENLNPEEAKHIVVHTATAGCFLDSKSSRPPESPTYAKICLAVLSPKISRHILPSHPAEQTLPLFPSLYNPNHL